MQDTIHAKTACAPHTVAGLSAESLILILIGAVDAVSTIIFVSLGWASEFNPIMAWCLNQSAVLFLVAKMATVAPFVVMCEVYRQREPVRGRAALRLAIAAYVILYLVTLAAVNFRFA